jgi:sulfate permease, SulP family
LTAMSTKMFTPKIFTTLKNYDRRQFTADLVSGIIVGIVALPLAIAFAIASGLSPEKGLYTAVIAGFVMSALGGSRVLIGGPTGAFVVIVYGIVQQYGVNGLIIATFLAGIILVLMGFLRLGSVIRYIPYPLIVGFTTGIALIIFSSQIKDFFGLEMGEVPADFFDKWKAYYNHIGHINIWAVAIAAGSVIFIQLWKKVTHKIPGSIIVLLLSTIVVAVFDIPVDTIGSRFGAIPSSIPLPSLPAIDLDVFQELIRPAITIALLGGIESLLAAVVADGMIGGNHKSNMELVGQGVGNMFSALFGGMPATGAIARTATNVKNGGRTPVAGIVHALILLIIMLFAGKWAAYIPMPCLAGILIVVAWNMSEADSFRALLKGPRGDVIVLLTTFVITVVVDITVAIEAGMVVSAFLFLQRMSQASSFRVVGEEENSVQDQISEYKVPPGILVFELSGPLFFGAAFKFRESLKRVTKRPEVLILRMGHVPVIDATGLNAIQQVFIQARERGTKVIISEIRPAVREAMDKSRLDFLIGRKNICVTLNEAIRRAEETKIRKVMGNENE